jgi:hypothetical protein
MKSVYHTFKVTDKKDLSPREAFEVARDIIEDVSTTLRDEWPRTTQLALANITKENDVRVYHFEVLEV